MTVTLFEEGASPGIYRVGLGDGSLFFFRDTYLGDLTSLVPKLAPGLDIEEDYCTRLRFAARCLLAERHAHRFIARQEHSRALLSQKLLKREYPEPIITAVLDVLESLSLLDDERYAGMYAESLLRRKPLGPRVLAVKLRNKGIHDKLVHRVLEKLWTDELAQETLSRWLAREGVDPRDPGLEGRAKLVKDGFTPSLLREYAEGLDDL